MNGHTRFVSLTGFDSCLCPSTGFLQELRFECYSMSVAVTGAIPAAVPSFASEATQDKRSEGEVKVWPPSFAPFEPPCDEKKDGDIGYSDYIMTSDVSTFPYCSLVLVADQSCP